MPWICGVEEAGRGPVLGPMAMAVCWVREEDEHLLVEAGAKDSKALTPQQREGTLERLEELRKKKRIGFELVLLSPREIDAAVEGENDNLNKLELRTSAMLIDKALASLGKEGRGKERLTKALIDCPTKNTAKYADDIKRLLKGDAAKEVEVIAEHKADVNYPVVSAASIIAKVHRDWEIQKLQERVNRYIGSGYPADPLTQQFLREHYKKGEYADLFRKSWASYKALVEAGKQRSLFSFQGRNGKEEREGDETERKHAAEMKEFDFLREHGFSFEAPKSRYEVVRLKGPDATVIKYTTGKLLVQGKGKAKVEKLLQNSKS